MAVTTNLPHTGQFRKPLLRVISTNPTILLYFDYQVLLWWRRAIIRGFTTAVTPTPSRHFRTQWGGNDGHADMPELCKNISSNHLQILFPNPAQPAKSPSNINYPSTTPQHLAVQPTTIQNKKKGNIREKMILFFPTFFFFCFAGLPLSLVASIQARQLNLSRGLH